MEQTRKIYYKDDFVATLPVEPIEGFIAALSRGGRFRGVLMTGPRGRYEFSYSGSRSYRCRVENGTIEIVADGHCLEPGELVATLWIDFPDSRFADGYMHKEVTVGFDCVLVAQQSQADGNGMATGHVELPVLVRSAYDIAAAQGYTGTAEEFARATAQMPQAVQAAAEVSALCSDWVAGKRLLAEALTQQGVATESTESFEAMAAKVGGLDKLAAIGYSSDEDYMGFMEAIATARELMENWPTYSGGNSKTLVGWKTSTGKPVSILPLIDTSGVTDASSLFRDLDKVTFIPRFDLSAMTNGAGLFSGTGILCIPPLDTKMCANWYSWLSDCPARRVEEIWFDSATDTSGAWYGSNVRYMVIRNIGQSGAATFDLMANSWGDGSEENRMSLVRSLRDYSYDRVSHGLGAVSMKIGSTLQSRLTQDEIAAITAKGYNLTLK